MRHEPDFSDWLDECTVLNRCYIETRYPTDIPFELSFATLNKMYEMARDMYAYICAQIDDETA